MHSALTQIAICKLKVRETICAHLHVSIEEVFYILVGKEFFFIGEKQFYIYKDCCIRVSV